MDKQSLVAQMARYDHWKRQLNQQLEQFQSWSKQHHSCGPDVQRSINRARKLLANTQYTVACVGEFSRGKTELINALLFSEYGHRLLPSTPGRTTMCPTEIYFDQHDPQNCVRLLPIETRRTTTSLQNFMRIPQKWVTLPIDPNNQDDIRQAIAQVSATKRVSREEARKMGFHIDPMTRAKDVAIPRWRHALISLDHPLLRQGLRILDTPGLNALGNEPELTLKTLPEAQAIIFLLAADSGVSASDMAIWRDHINKLRQHRGTEVLALLNKIDALWDDLISPEQIEDSIRSVRRHTAHLLDIPVSQVLPLSAKQGLLAKAQQDSQRFKQSRFGQLESVLAHNIVSNQANLLQHPTIADAFSIMRDTRTSLQQRLIESDQELQTLQQQPDNSEQQRQAATELRSKIRIIHGRFHKQSLSLKTSQRLLERQTQALTAPVNLSTLQRYVDDAKLSLEQSWTSLGLINSINQFFETLHHSLDNLEREAEQANRVLSSIYQRPEHVQSGANMLKRHLFKTRPFRQRLHQLQHQMVVFRSSLNTLLASKSTIISRFINTLVREIQALYRDINQAIAEWTESALTPLVHHNRYQKQLLEHQMVKLASLTQGDKSHGKPLESLKQEAADQEEALLALDALLNKIAGIEPPSSTAESRDNVVQLTSARVAV